MKKYFLIIVGALLLTSCASKSSFHSFYNENRNDSDFSLSTPAFFANIFIPKQDIREYEDLFKKVKHYKVMVFSDKVTSLDRKFDRFIRNKKYTSIFRVNDSGSSVQFYFLENKSTIKEMVLKIKSDDSYVLLGLKTNITFGDFETIIDKSDMKISSY
ncbi:DUF4252 domain-containing protein [uncultured Lutibacter sp.]|uniref:DUF4252 domain-containing protein n=1 Tax=uncultured Lutibacter sp. TaxID=437739 RepID=UPI002625BCCE|nr:DUF4252 domain-containing protein [uncultured Lutibacter sp.]